MRMIKSISRLISKVGKNMSVGILIIFPEDGNFFSVRNDSRDKKAQYLYIDIDITSLIGVSFKYDFTLVDKSIIDSEKKGQEKIYLHQFSCIEFTNVIKKFMDFMENNDNIFIFNKDTNHIEVNYQLFDNNVFEYIYKDYKIKFKPRIIDNDSSEQYVNVLFEYIGDTKAVFTKVALIRYNELRALYGILKEIDIFMYSQALLNYVGKKTIFLEKQDLKNTEVIGTALELAEKKIAKRIEQRRNENEKGQADGN